MKSLLFVIYLIANSIALNAQSKNFNIAGRPFPTLKLNGLENNLITLNVVKPAEQYTLIYFWFSNCKPCFQEFSALKIIYSQFKKSGFSIIGISVDKKADFLSWKNVIEQYKLDWIQYLDEGGSEAKKLFVDQLPTNFLLNSTGEIIRRNISPIELKYFLLKGFSIEKPIFDKIEGPEPYN